MAGAIKHPEEGTELGAFAAYLHYLEEDAAIAGIDVFRPQGLAVVPKGKKDAAEMACASSLGRYLAVLGFLDDRGNARNMTEAGPRDMLPSWRSFYRWVQLGRTHAQAGRGNWSMAEGSSAHPRASKYICNAYATAAAKRPASGDDWEAALVEGLWDELNNFVAQYKDKRHNDLPPQFKQIAKPSWIDTSVNPPTVRNNKFAFGLDPALRVLSNRSGSFHWADPIAEPCA